MVGSKKSVECADSVHSTPRGRKTRVARASLCVFLSGMASGCYVYPPVVTAPTQGTEVRLDLNDRGRVGLGGQIGPTATRVEGVVQASTDTAYALKVTSVTYLSGDVNRWTGESLTVPRDFVAATSEKKFSKSKSLLTAAGVVGGVVAFIATRGLLGGGTPDTGGGGGGGGGNSFR